MNCSPQLSQQFLQDELSHDDQQSFEDHLEQCEVCRKYLDEQASSVAESLNLQSRLALSHDVPTWHSAPDQTPVIDRERSFASDLASLAPSDDPNSLGRIGLYEARAIIGRGGMGTVYKATDPVLGRTVAIKVLKPDLASIGSARRRFALEARAMASIAHPHVVPIHAVDEHGGLPYMAMEYVPGGNLEARLKSNGPLELISVLRIAQQIASALQAAHECGLVHRDIKPANILLDRGVDRVRVADFGLVRISDDASMTRSGIIAGTPMYMAPEQVRGEACDARSDLFSLGSLMYTLLAGHAPFRAETPYAAMLRIVHEDPRPLRESRSDVPEWLASFIEKLQAKKPEDRFESAAKVAELLETELVHLQSPQAGGFIQRAWLEPHLQFRKPSNALNGNLAKRRSSRWLGRFVIASAVAGMVIWSVSSWLGNSLPSSTVRSEIQSVTGMVSPVPTRPRMPLWADDGYDELAREFDRQNRLPETTSTEMVEGWWNEVREIQREIMRLESLEQ